MLDITFLSGLLRLAVYGHGVIQLITPSFGIRRGVALGPPLVGQSPAL